MQPNVFGSETQTEMIKKKVPHQAEINLATPVFAKTLKSEI